MALTAPAGGESHEGGERQRIGNEPDEVGKRRQGVLTAEGKLICRPHSLGYRRAQRGSGVEAPEPAYVPVGGVERSYGADDRRREGDRDRNEVDNGLVESGGSWR